jgi:hypothetical protein
MKILRAFYALIFLQSIAVSSALAQTIAASDAKNHVGDQQAKLLLLYVIRTVKRGLRRKGCSGILATVSKGMW